VSRRASRIAIFAAIAAAVSSGQRAHARAVGEPANRPADRATDGRAPVGYTYTVQTRDNGDPDDRFVVRVLGDAARVDGVGSSHGAKARDYLLVLDNGTRVLMVHPEDRTYHEATGEEFEAIIGTVLRTVGKVMTFKLRNATVRTERLGAGETILGMSTERYRVTQDFTTGVGALGFTKDIQQRVVTEYWVSKELPLAGNPVVALIANAKTALAQQDPDYVRRVRRERLAFCTGMPLRMVVTSYSGGEDGMTKDESVQTIDVSDVKRAEINPASLRVPAGYAKQDSKFGWSLNL
jgi:hypothetical protein